MSNKRPHPWRISDLEVLRMYEADMSAEAKRAAENIPLKTRLKLLRMAKKTIRHVFGAKP